MYVPIPILALSLEGRYSRKTSEGKVFDFKAHGSCDAARLEEGGGGGGGGLRGRETIV
jgi:hypothetical protein